MNQARRRPLRTCHLLLLVPLLMASAPPPASQPVPSAQALAAAGFRVHFPTSPVAGTWAPFTVTALGSDGRPLEAFLGVVTVTASGTGADVDPDVYTYLLVDKGVGQFKALWLNSGPQRITVVETLGPTHEETVPVLAGPATRFELAVPTAPVQAGTMVRAKVVAFDANNNVATEFTGPIQFTSTDDKAVLPLNPTFELADQGEKSFDIVFRTEGSQTLTVLDARTPIGIPQVTQTVMVTPGPPTSLQLIPSTNTTTAGQTFDVTVRGTDESGNSFPYAGPLQFSSSDRLAFLPTGTVNGPGPFTLALKTAGVQTVTATGMNAITGQLRMAVSPGSFYEVLMASPATQPVDTCTSAVVQLRAADRYGNTVPEAKDVILCGTPGETLDYTDHTLTDARSEAVGCISGKLSSTGEGQVSWSNSAPGSITFFVTPSIGRPLLLSWQHGGFSPEDSILSFPGATGSPPSLRTFTGELSVLFELRNACGAPVDPPSGRVLGFIAASPLLLGSTVVREDLGRWSTSVRLPKCPDNASAPLKIAPTLDGEPIPLPSGENLHAELLPNCLPSDVQLELQVKPQDAKATPGALVEFELTLSNTGDDVIPEGLLWLEAAALSGREARLDDGPFEAVDNKLTLPPLEPGATRTVKIRGQAAVQTDQPVTLTAWYSTLAGAALTEKKALSLEWDQLGADVGCGCQTGTLPSQLLPWWALLAAASRSRTRLRRLTRGERIDR
jgi:hypothetical protein